MSDQPWRDRLARARSGPERVAPTIAEPPKTASAPSDLLASAGPALAKLLAEREELEARMAALTDLGGSQDPRFPVAPLAERRAEYRRWETAREALREQRSTPAMPTPSRAEPAERGDQPGPAGREDTAPLPPLRDVTRRVAAIGGLIDQVAALRDVTVADPLARFATAIDGAEARASALLSGQTPFRDRLTNTLRDQMRARLPQLPERAVADPYLREMRRKLAVDTGSIEEIGARSEKLAETALAIRELREADEDRDESRRERALARLRGRRDNAA